MTLVLDGSVAIAWCFRDGRTPVLNELQRRVEQHGAVVPAIWPMEVANGLLMGIRRGRLSPQERDDLVESLCDLDLEPDGQTEVHVWSATTQLAERHRLTIYDAAYLELALRRRLPLATLDVALARAAVAEGVATLP